MWYCCQRPTGYVRLLVQSLAIFQRRSARHFSGVQWFLLCFNTCKRHTYYASYRRQCFLAKSQNQTQWAFPQESRLQPVPPSTPSVNSLLLKALTRITSHKEGGRRITMNPPTSDGHFWSVSVHLVLCFPHPCCQVILVVRNCERIVIWVPCSQIQMNSDCRQICSQSCGMQSMHLESNRRSTILSCELLWKTGIKSDIICAQFNSLFRPKPFGVQLIYINLTVGLIRTYRTVNFSETMLLWVWSVTKVTKSDMNGVKLNKNFFCVCTKLEIYPVDSV